MQTVQNYGVWRRSDAAATNNASAEEMAHNAFDSEFMVEAVLGEHQESTFEGSPAHTLLAMLQMPRQSLPSLLSRAVRGSASALARGALSVGSQLGISPPAMPADGVQMRRLLYRPGGYADQQDVRDLRAEIKQVKKAYGSARLVVGGVGKYDWRLPWQPHILLLAAKRRPNDVVLHEDALRYPDVFGDVSSPQTMQRFAPESFAEILFLNVGRNLFGSRSDHSWDAYCESMRGLRDVATSESAEHAAILYQPHKGRDTWAEACRVLQPGGRMVLLDAPSLSDLERESFEDIAKLPLRIDVISAMGMSAGDRVAHRGLGQPWHKDTLGNVMILTKLHSASRVVHFGPEV